MIERRQTARTLLGDPGLPNAQRLAGKVAVVSGAGARPFEGEPDIVGNGKAIAITFAREGARVALVDKELDWAGDTQRIIEEEEAKLKPVKAKRLSDMTDGEWIVSLEQEPHLQGVNIRREIAACPFW